MEGARDFNPNTRKWEKRFNASEFQALAEKNQPDGYPGLEDGLLDPAQMPPATATTRGAVKLAGQFSGTADSPVVTGIRELGGALLTFGSIPNETAMVRLGSQIIGATDQSILGAIGSGNRDTQFQWLSATQIRLNPTGLDGRGRVIVARDAELQSILIDNSLTWDITVPGLGGLDTGSETANTGYEIRLVTKADGTGAGLLGTISGNTPLLPTSYTHKSKVIGFASNTEGGSNLNIFPFDVAGDYWMYRYPDAGVANTGIQLLLNGRATTATAIDCSDYIPTSAIEGTFWGIGINISPTARSGEAIDSKGAKRILFRCLQTTEAYETVSSAMFSSPFWGTPAVDMTYRWQPSAPAVGEGFSLYVIGFRMAA